MMSPSTRRSPRQLMTTRRSLGNTQGTPIQSRRSENAPLQPSPLRNEISSSSSTKKSRKRARSLGGAGNDDPTAPSSAKQTNPRKKRMTIVFLRLLTQVTLGAGSWDSKKGDG